MTRPEQCAHCGHDLTQARADLSSTSAKLLLTVNEAADLLSISVSQMYRLHQSGQIAFTRLGERSTRVHIDEVRSFAASLKTF